jgi:predicted Zn-dependent protease
MTPLRLTLVFAGLTLLAGCGTAPLRRAEPSTVTPPASKPQVEEEPRAISALLSEAEAAVARGEEERAAAFLERAIRIAPGNPLPWSRLAEVRLQQSQTHLAEQLAVKSNRLAGNLRELKTRNWQTIARARRRMGDDAGAREAEEEAARTEQP